MLRFCQRVQHESGKRHPPTSRYGHFAFLSFSESLIVPLSTHSLYHTDLCIHQHFSADDSPTPFIILSPIS